MKYSSPSPAVDCTTLVLVIASSHSCLYGSLCLGTYENNSLLPKKSIKRITEMQFRLVRGKVVLKNQLFVALDSPLVVDFVQYVPDSEQHHLLGEVELGLV